MNDRMPHIRALSRRAALAGAAQALALLAAGCTQLPQIAAPAGLASPTPPATPAPAATPGPACLAGLPAVTRPTPIPYPGYTAVEPSTQLHVTAPPQVIELDAYLLTVKGKVAHELTLTYDELRCLPKIGTYARIECPGFFVDYSNLAGASLASVLALAGPLEGASWTGFTGIDGRSSGIPLGEAQGGECFLAYEWEGEALPVSHGFPIRAALPGSLGGPWVKWLTAIEIS
ncbi:MAG: molybdopterin-dependent oxidoreductase [Nitrososphaerales archaeon]